MSDLRTTLQGYLRNPAARQLARATPAMLLAGVSGAALGAVLHDPNMVQGGVGFIIGGVAVNHLTDLLTKLLHMPIEQDLERVEIIEQGLNQRDAGVSQAAAAALVQAGPDLALALPADGRAALVDALATGMAGAGGALAAIAAAYAGALREPSADWAALQAELRATVQRVSQTMEATDQGVIERSDQRVEGANGPVEQTMRASGGGKIINSGQTVIGGRRRAGDSSDT